MRIVLPALAAAGLVLAESPSPAQPDPSAKITCADLRAALAKLPPIGQDIVSIQVTGTLAAVTANDAVSFLVVCSPPDVQVACVAYATEGHRAGDRITVAGSIQPGSREARILLDPCINFPAEGPS